MPDIGAKAVPTSEQDSLKILDDGPGIMWRNPCFNTHSLDPRGFKHSGGNSTSLDIKRPVESRKPNPGFEHLELRQRSGSQCLTTSVMYLSFHNFSTIWRLVGQDTIIFLVTYPLSTFIGSHLLLSAHEPPGSPRLGHCRYCRVYQWGTIRRWYSIRMMRLPSLFTLIEQNSTSQSIWFHQTPMNQTVGRFIKYCD